MSLTNNYNEIQLSLSGIWKSQKIYLFVTARMELEYVEKLTDRSSKSIRLFITFHLDRHGLDSTFGRRWRENNTGAVVSLTQLLMERHEVSVSPVDGVLVLCHPVKSNTGVNSEISTLVRGKWTCPETFVG